MTTITFTDNELPMIHAALLDKISNLKADHPFVKQYRNMLKSADLKIKAAMNIVFGISSKSSVSSEAIEKEHNHSVQFEMANNEEVSI